MPTFDWMERTFAGNSARTWLVVGLVLMLGLLIGRLAGFVMTRFGPKLAARTASNVDDRLIDRLNRPVAALLFLGALHVSVRILTMAEHWHRLATDAVMIGATFVLGIGVLRTIDVIYEEWMVPWADRQKPSVSVAVLNFARVTGKVVAVLVLAVAVLQRAGFDVVSVVTGLGIGGLAVALAAQETLGNLLGSMQIMTDRPFTLGDWVRVDGHFGRVTDIGLRSTRLQQANGVRIVMPNKKVAEAHVENHSYSSGLVRDFTLGLTFATTPAQMQQAVDIAKALLLATPGINADLAVNFVKFGDWSMDLRIVYHADPARAGDIAHEVNVGILAAFGKAGLQMAFPTRTLHVAPNAVVAAAAQTAAQTEAQVENA